MKIHPIFYHFGSQRIYCPSTDEALISSSKSGFNSDATAFIAMWHVEFLSIPVFNNLQLQSAWEKFVAQGEKEGGSDTLNALLEFLEGYSNEQWKVYACEYDEPNMGIGRTTVYLVVKNDTVLETDPGCLEGE